MLYTVARTRMYYVLQVGVSVIVLSTKGDSPEKGYVRFVGEVDFASGTWVGVQLDNPKGEFSGNVCVHLQCFVVISHWQTSATFNLHYYLLFAALLLSIPCELWYAYIII